MPSPAPFKITKFGIVGNLTGSVQGTASCAITASYVSGAVLSPSIQNLVEITSASYSAIVNPDPNTLYVITDDTASIATASFAETAKSASYALNATSASMAGEAISASYALTASFCENAGPELPLETGSAPYSLQSTTGSIASGTASFAHGNGVVASGSYSHAEGFSTRALGQNSHVEGSYTTSSGNCSHAEGLSAKALGDYSHAEGSNTKASGYCSHVEGSYTIASGSHSHAEGSYTTSSGNCSHAEGGSTVASNDYEHAQGKYNVTASSQIFSIGCGDNNARRKNAISVITGSKTVSSASVYIYGVGTYNGTNPQPGTNDLATVVGSLTSSVTSASYDSTDKEIQFFNGAGTKVAFVDATDFIKDGMLASASVSASYLVLTFNTDAGQEPISMSLLDIFDPSNYYAKSDLNPFTASVTAMEAKTGSWDGKWTYDEATIQAVKVDSASNADNATSASYALTASHALNVKDLPLETGSAPYAIQSTTASVASGTASFAHGFGVSAFGQYSHVEGYYTNASGSYSHAEGESTIALGHCSHAEGHGTRALGNLSHAEGSSTKASGSYSHAEGESTIALGHCSHAEGNGTNASGNWSHAEGFTATASGQYSHAEGTRTNASGYGSHAEGWNTIASGQYSHAEGWNAIASGNYSHAEGYYAKASGKYSHAEGAGTTAFGDYSHAEGAGTTAFGDYSHAEGGSTVASNNYEHAQGQYNATASSQIFSVGCGDHSTRRKNAISIITGSGAALSASVYIYGVGGYDGTNISGSVDLANTLIGIANAAAKKPVVLYETDGTTGLLGHNANTYEGHWQLKDYDFTPYKRLECFFKASATSSADVYTPAIVVTIPLDEAAKGPNIYMGSQMIGLPFNRNRQYFVGCAVDSTKTKFQVVHQNTIWDITTSDANSVGRYMYKILGYFD